MRLAILVKAQWKEREYNIFKNRWTISLISYLLSHTGIFCYKFGGAEREAMETRGEPKGNIFIFYIYYIIYIM